MADILYISSRNPPQPSHVATPNEPLEDPCAPPPPSEEPWLCDEPHKYSIKASKNPLERCNQMLERYDERTYTQLKEEINFLMVVAGLFLAIVAAFTIESYKFLQEDKQDTMSDLLVEVVRLLNDTSAQGKAQLPKRFTPKHHDIVVNQLWFLSMILSLIAVAMGTYCLQWISAFSRSSDLTPKSIPFHESLAVRQFRHDGLDGWGVRYAPEALLFIVQLSIGLFICGLVYFLWNVSETAAIPTLVMTGIAAASLCLINLLPFLQALLVAAFHPSTLKVSQCPYKSPTSWFIYNAGIVLLRMLQKFLEHFQYNWFWLWYLLWKIGRLHLTGFDWKMFDDAMQGSRINSHSKFYYFESGLISALNRFPYEGEAKDIVSSYLESLVPLLNGEQASKIFHSDNPTDDEIARLFVSVFTPVPPRRLNTTPLQKSEYANQIKTDFGNAIILQRLSKRSHGSLDHLLFKYRLELHIRVKNSTESIMGLDHDGSRLEISRSLDCPYEFHDYDSFHEKLNLELKFQFLRCVRQLIDTRRLNDGDIRWAAEIVENEAHMTLPQNIQNLSETQHMDRPAEEEHTGLLANQSSSRNIHIGNLSDQPDPGTTSSPPNAIETGGPESATHNTSAEDQFRTSFESLCLEVKKQLSGLRPSDFKEKSEYRRMRYILKLPFEPEPEGVRIHTAIDVSDHEVT